MRRFHFGIVVVAICFSASVGTSVVVSVLVQSANNESSDMNHALSQRVATAQIETLTARLENQRIEFNQTLDEIEELAQRVRVMEAQRQLKPEIVRQIESAEAAIESARQRQLAAVETAEAAKEAAHQRQREVEEVRHQQEATEQQRREVEETERQRQAEEERLREQEVAQREREAEAQRQREAEEHQRREAEAERQREAAEAAEAAMQRQLADEAEAAANAQQAEHAANNFINIARRRVEEKWEIPSEAGDSMSAGVHVRLGASGELLANSITRSSGDSTFDRSAIQAVENAAPFGELRDLPAHQQRNLRQFVLRFTPGDIR